MAISNSSQGARPGICTSTSRPTNPYEGQMIYETDTNRVLVWDNAAWVMIADTDSPPGLELVKTQSFSGATSAAPVDVTGCFTSNYLNYLVRFNTTAGSANVEISAQMLSGTTPASGANYRMAGTGSTQAAVTSNDGTLTRTSIPVSYSTANGTVGGEIAFYQPQTTVRTTFFCDFFYDDGGTLIYRRYGGQHNLANSYDGLRLFPATGNITGTLSVYGYRN